MRSRSTWGAWQALWPPLIGKEPPNIHIWVVGGQAPTFIREQGPLYPDGPILTIELASPVWPESAQRGE